MQMKMASATASKEQTPSSFGEDYCQNLLYHTQSAATFKERASPEKLIQMKKPKKIKVKKFKLVE